jgi:hypothetical protein
MALKYDVVVTGEQAGLTRLWTVVEGLPNSNVPGTGYSFRMWGDRVSLDYASRTDEAVSLGGDIHGRTEWRSGVWPDISREFPDLTFRVTYTGGDWHADVVEYRDGHGNTVEQWTGYFVTCDPSAAPVHHWTVWGDFDPELLTPYLIPGSKYEHPHGNYPVRDADGVRTAIDTRLGADSSREWGLAPWTLVEDVYVESIQTIHDSESDYHLELKSHVLDLLAVVQRDITLTPDEVSVLAHDALSGHLELVQLERDLLNRSSNTGVPLHPTPDMIRHLLVRSEQVERRYQLGAAFKSPRWAGIDGRWPKWELLAKQWEETRGRPPEPLPPPDMEAFAAELRELEARDPVQG